jgi:hypothetical protein
VRSEWRSATDRRRVVGMHIAAVHEQRQAVGIIGPRGELVTGNEA